MACKEDYVELNQYIAENSNDNTIIQPPFKELWIHRDQANSYLTGEIGVYDLKWDHPYGPCVVDPYDNVFYYVNDLLHRYDGVANNYGDDTPYAGWQLYSGWYLYGEHVDEEKYKKFLVDNNIDINNITTEDKLFIHLSWNTILPTIAHDGSK